MSSSELIEASSRFVVPSYAKFPLVLSRGQGARVWDVEGREYLDMGMGIAVCSIGHSHPELADALAKQARTLIHTSNLYHTEPQIRLAERLVRLVGPGKVFFCSSGAEANEALYEMARKFGHDSGRYEILTTLNSFHGRTLAGIAATGQEKVKKGFEPPVQGFRHVPFNDLEAMHQAVSDKTVAILIEGIQGEIGIYPATAEYLSGLRKLCDEKKLLLMVDAIQCGMFRTGRFQSYERILEKFPDEKVDFLPDAISMAKGLANGIPIGSIWVRQPYANVLSAGTHGTTFGGTPFACTAALTVLEIIQRDHLDNHARKLGEELKSKILALKSPHIREVRGLGFMLGVELNPNIVALTVEGKAPAVLMVSRLQELGMLTIPSAPNSLRLLPPLNLTPKEMDEAMEKLKLGLDSLG